MITMSAANKAFANAGGQIYSVIGLTV